MQQFGIRGVRPLRRVRCSASTLTILLAVAASADARVLYVDGSLSSSCNGNYSVTSRSCAGNDGSAYPGFAAAVSAMQPGDTVMIRAGVYRTPLIVNKSGSATAHLRFAAYAAEKPVIDLAGVSSGNGIELSSQRYIDVDGLSVQHSPAYGVKGSSGDHLTVSNTEVGYSYHGGIIFEHATDIVVTGCNVHHNNTGGLGSWHEAISFADVNQFRVSNCDVHDNYKEGIDAKYGATGGTISRNRTYRNNGPNIYIDAANTIEVSGNICHETVSNNKACIGLSIESAYNPTQESMHDIKVFNNVIYGSGAGVWFWVESPTASFSKFSNIRIEHNTFADNTSNNWGGIYVMNGGSSNFGPGITVRNNVFWNNSGGAIRDSGGAVAQFSIDHNLFKSGESSASFGTNAVLTSTNPFVNQPARDYHLTGTSPAIGIGQPISDITTDADGVPRPSGATDAGAYQHKPSGTVTAPRPPTNVRIG